MNPHSLLFALFILLSAAPPILKGEEASPLALVEAQSSPSFLPLDWWPERGDFNTVLKFHTSDFESILPHFAGDSFYELPDLKVAVSDHYVTWGEITDFLNNMAWRTGNDFRHLYTGTLAKTITRKCEKVSFFESRYKYEVNLELATEPALLSLATMQRYINWRESHYWRYARLLNQEKRIADPDDAMVRYFKDHLLWPMIKLDQNIDNLYDVVEKSTEIGTFSLSEDGSCVEKMNSDVSYRLPTQEEISSWKGTPLSGKVWGMTSLLATDPAACGAFDAATGEEIENSQGGAEECYGILALNTEKMKSNPDFQKKEEMLQGERAHFEDFLQQVLLKAANDGAAYEKEKASSTGAVFSDGTNVLMWMTGIGELASLGFAAYQGVRALALYAAKKEGIEGAKEGVNECLVSASKALLKDEEKEKYTYLKERDHTLPLDGGSITTWTNANEYSNNDDVRKGPVVWEASRLWMFPDVRGQEAVQQLNTATKRASWWAVGGVIAAGFLEGLKDFSSTAYGGAIVTGFLEGLRNFSSTAY